jgi:hypothetical protein
MVIRSGDQVRRFNERCADDYQLLAARTLDSATGGGRLPHPAQVRVRRDQPPRHRLRLASRRVRAVPIASSDECVGR